MPITKKLAKLYRLRAIEEEIARDNEKYLKRRQAGLFHLLRAIGKHEDLQMLQCNLANDSDENVFDFNRILPVPERLKEESEENSQEVKTWKIKNWGTQENIY